MKYEVRYIKYKFLVESELAKNYESLDVYYYNLLIIKIKFFADRCLVGYNNEYIHERDGKQLDAIFRTYNRDALAKIPKIVEVFYDKYHPEFLQLTSIIV